MNDFLFWGLMVLNLITLASAIGSVFRLNTTNKILFRVQVAQFLMAARNPTIEMPTQNEIDAHIIAQYGPEYL